MKLKGFTLAEVLIAMTIIGVIASLTLPTLGMKKNRQEYATKLKKFYSKMDNAITEMETEDGAISYMEKPEDGYAWYIQHIDSHMGHQILDADNKIIYTKEGSSISGFAIDECLELIFDVNSAAPPNATGKDRFSFMICFDDTNKTKWFGNTTSSFGTYAKNLNAVTTTRATMVESCKSTPKTCSRLLENDQWQILSDYPHKI